MNLSNSITGTFIKMLSLITYIPSNIHQNNRSENQ